MFNELERASMTDTTSAAPSLLPCPFCGSTRLERSCITHDDVACLDCDALAPSLVAWNRRAQPTPPAVVEPPELSPDFTDTARAALLWVLWHHQGGSSPVGQAVRFALGMGQFDRLTDQQVTQAKSWAPGIPGLAHMRYPDAPSPNQSAEGGKEADHG